jgi:sugar/nucleoside kinase (ribokinase family)
MISSSTVHILDSKFSFPRPNEYAEIKQTLPSVGGEAINSAIMLSKLGIKTRIDGNWLNKHHSDKILNLIKPYKIDTSRLTIVEKYGTEEVVITDNNSRTVFGNYANFHNGEKQWNDPKETDIQKSKYVSIDPYFREQSIEAAKICVKHQKPYVTIDCKYENFLSNNAEAIIISHELRDMEYKENDAQDIFEKYLTHCKGLVIFTFGSDELWYARSGQQINKFKPYKINPIDTTGAGDSFRSGIIFGLMNSWDDEKILDFASAVAACVCLTIPHTLNAPGLVEINKFIKEYKR